MAQPQLNPRTFEATHEVPLCVDLDGTLVTTDMLLESICELVRSSPAYLILLPLWLFRGWAYLKRKVAQCTDLDVAILPYNQPFLKFLKAQHRKGRVLNLVTAADKKIANKVARYVGLFSAVFASDGKVNLKGKMKRQVLEEKYGSGGYSYAGNAKEDLEVWRRADEAIVVSQSKALVERVKSLGIETRVFSAPRNLQSKGASAVSAVFLLSTAIRDVGLARGKVLLYAYGFSLWLVGDCPDPYPILGYTLAVGCSFTRFPWHLDRRKV